MNIVIVMEYSDSYSKTFGSLWQYCKDNSAVNVNVVIVAFNVPLEYLRNFWVTLEMLLI